MRGYFDVAGESRGGGAELYLGALVGWDEQETLKLETETRRL